MLKDLHFIPYYRLNLNKAKIASANASGDGVSFSWQPVIICWPSSFATPFFDESAEFLLFMYYFTGKCIQRQYDYESGMRKISGDFLLLFMNRTVRTNRTGELFPRSCFLLRTKPLTTYMCCILVLRGCSSALCFLNIRWARSPLRVKLWQHPVFYH